MNTNLTPTMLYHQPKGIPTNLHIWQDENYGTAALLNAAQDLLEGKTIRFALCDREGAQAPVIREIVTLAMGNNHTPRYCGENNDPDGPGSHALIASWYDYASDPAAICTAMALAFTCNHKYFFRLA